MIKKGLLRRMLLVTLLLLLIVNSTMESKAQEDTPNSQTDIIFLIDCSKSMEQVDEGYLVLDFIKEIAASVPRQYNIGAVIYANEASAVIPVGSSQAEIKYGLQNVEYKGYGDAGAGLIEAIRFFQDAGQDKRIVLISDGEIVMDKDDKTQQSADLFANAVQEAADKGIKIDVVALGEKKEEGETVYAAAASTGGRIYTVNNVDSLAAFGGRYLFEEYEIKARTAGRLIGTKGEFEIELPDVLMTDTKIVLTGKQKSESAIVLCDAEKMTINSGKAFTVVHLKNPASDKVKINLSAEEDMDIDCYLTAEYDIETRIENTYSIETGEAQIVYDIVNINGESLFKGHLSEGGFPLYVNGKEEKYVINENGINFKMPVSESKEVEVKADISGMYGYYFGETSAETYIVVPVVEEEPQIDWFFWSVVSIFVLGIILIFFFWGRKKKYGRSYMQKVDRRVELPEEGRPLKHEFTGRILIYIIRNKEGVDYPPESINLFARSKRDIITLQWLLDTCGLPLEPEGADKILIKAGAQKQLVVKNNSRATALKGREVMLKSHQYPVFYNEKITFIFDKEDTEIEVHYKDLR